jgi:purine-binding chemotaxis protein CheW
MRIKFHLADVRYDQFTVVVILHFAGRVIGLVVDGVSDVIALATSEVKEAPSLGSVVDGTFIAGLGTQDDRMVLLLDIEKLLSSGELNLLQRAADAAPAIS